MKRIICLMFLLFSFIFSNPSAIAKEATFPKETVLLEFPDQSEEKWKEILRFVSDTESNIERIPIHQTAQNWTDLIAMHQYVRSPQLSLSRYLQEIHKSVVSAYPGKEVIWKVLESTAGSAIYEWILSSAYKDIPPQHAISRVFFTEKAIHGIIFNKQKSMMSSSERANWIDLFKNHTTVIEWPLNTVPEKGLSLADSLPNSLVFPEFFHNWKMEHAYRFDQGLTIIGYVPISQGKSFYPLSLEITTQPGERKHPLKFLFEAEKKVLNSRFKQPIAVSILHENPDEIVYSFSYKQDKSYLNAVARSFITERGYYSLCYYLLSNRELKTGENFLFAEQLKLFHIKGSVHPCKVTVR